LVSVTDTSSTDNEWLIISNDLEKHPPYTFLDRDVVSAGNNVLVAYLSPMGFLTVVLATPVII